MFYFLLFTFRIRIFAPVFTAIGKRENSNLYSRHALISSVLVLVKQIECIWIESFNQSSIGSMVNQIMGILATMYYLGLKKLHIAWSKSGLILRPFNFSKHVDFSDFVKKLVVSHIFGLERKDNSSSLCLFIFKTFIHKLF